MVEAFKPLKWEVSENDLKEIGKKIHLLKIKYKLDEGFDYSKLRFPKRILETPTPHGSISPEFMSKAVELYRARISEKLKQLEPTLPG